MDTDFQRTERQRKVIALALEKARQADAGTLTNLAKAILPQISTSVGIEDVLPLVKDIDQLHIARQVFLFPGRQSGLEKWTV